MGAVGRRRRTEGIAALLLPRGDLRSAAAVDGIWRGRGFWDLQDPALAAIGNILVNYTSVGMAPEVRSSPVLAQRLRPETVVFGAICNLAQTRSLRNAYARGCRVVSGVELFIAQAVAQLRLWHGRAALQQTSGSASALSQPIRPRQALRLTQPCHQ